jgi:hypothetical protein
MHIKFKSLCNASKHMTMHISNANNTSSWACTPYLCAFLCPRILIPSHSSMLLPLCPIYFSSSSQSLPQAFISLYNLPPFVINFHKRCASLDTKGCPRDRWLTLESCIFYRHHLYSSLDTMCRILWPWHQLVGHLPLCHGMGHPILINLSSCRWGNFLHLMIT